MNTLNHAKTLLVLGIATASTAMVGCHKEEEVKEYLRKHACELIKNTAGSAVAGNARLAGCQAGTDEAYKFSKVLFQNSVKADPLEVYLATLSWCLNQYASQTHDGEGL